MHPAIRDLTRRRPRFTTVRKHIGDCDFCSDICRNNAQPTKGRLPVLFVGESPSKIGAIKNDIFRGMSYRLMKKWKDEVYMTNAICCVSEDVHPRHLQNCRPWLHALIKAIQPKAVVSFGNVAFDQVSKIRANWTGAKWDFHIFAHPMNVIRGGEKIEKKWVEKVDAVVEFYRQ